MHSIIQFGIIYLFGGLTFIPLVIYTVLRVNKINKSEAERIDNREADKSNESLIVNDIDPNFKLGKLLEDEGVNVYKKGWITVTKKYYYHFSEIPSLNIDPDSKDGSQILERSQLKKKQRYYAILKHGNLFLYKKDDASSDLVNAISLKNHFVTLWPRKPDAESLDASLFTKRTCIAIFDDSLVEYDIHDNRIKFNEDVIYKNNLINNNETTNTDGKVENAATSPVMNATNTFPGSPPITFYLYFTNNMDKEDWYFQLINACKTNVATNSTISPLDPSVTAKTAHLNTHDTLLLIQNLNSTEGQAQTQWFNALIGRLFLTLQQTDSLNKALYDSVCKKLRKINKPGFLDDFEVKKVDVGDSAPLITNPKLAGLSPNGSTKITFDLVYRGNMSLNIATQVQINLGSRFTQREVPIQLAIKVKEISGPMVLIIKPPPSNRIWYAFETNPILDFDIEPVVSSSKLSYNVITNVIKNKFIEGIQESLVVPFMDDLAFFPTSDDIYRGGIWDKKNLSTGSIIPPKYNQDLPEHQEQFDNHELINNHLSTSEYDNLNNDTVSITSSINMKGGQNGNVKQRTIQKIGNLKEAIQFRKSTTSSTLSAETERTDDAPSLNSNENEGEQDTSKKYFKNSIKKFNRWYKDTVNINEETDLATSKIENNQAPSSEEVNKTGEAELSSESGEKSYETNPFQVESKTSPTVPTMISNRRKTGPKITSNVDSVAEQNNANSPVSNTNSGHLISPTSPVSNMFVNHERTRSISSGTSSHEFNSLRKSSFNNVHNQNVINNLGPTALSVEEYKTKSTITGAYTNSQFNVSNSTLQHPNRE